MTRATAAAESAVPQPFYQNRADALLLMRDHLKSGDVEAAKLIYDETVQATGIWPLSMPVLVKLIQELMRHGQKAETLSLVEDFAERYPEYGAHLMRKLGHTA